MISPGKASGALGEVVPSICWMVVGCLICFSPIQALRVFTIGAEREILYATASKSYLIVALLLAFPAFRAYKLSFERQPSALTMMGLGVAMGAPVASIITFACWKFSAYSQDLVK